MIHPGQVVWRELVTPVPAESLAFLAEVLGWSARAVPMGEAEAWQLVAQESPPVPFAGLMRPLMDGIPAHWLDYVAVADVGAALERVRELGGQAITEVMDLPIGPFALVADPAGAHLGLTEPRGPSSTSPFCWSHLHSPALAGVLPFYEGLFGWTPESLAAGPTLLRHRGRPIASASASEVEAAWLPWVAVPHLDTALACAREAGASLLEAPRTLQGLGRFAVLAEPGGAILAFCDALTATSS